MKLITSLMLALAVLANLALGFRVGGKYQSRWSAYVSKHGLTFATAAAELKTYASYSANLDYISAWNSNPDNTFKIKENHFTHLSQDEFRSQVLMPPRQVVRSPSKGKTVSASKVGLTLKSSVNYTKYFVPAKNQGFCGSCYSFAAAGVVEALYAMKYGGLISLSEQQILDCTFSDNGNSYNKGCDGGDCFYSFSYIRNNGLCPESKYAYSSFFIEEDSGNGYTGECKTTVIDQYCNVVKIKNYGLVTMGDENVLAAYIQAYGPVTVYIDAGVKSFSFYSSGIYNDAKCSNSVTNHAVIAVGFGSFGPGQDYWIIRNSWDTDWGMNGYGLIARNKNDTCGVATSPFYAQLT